MSDLNAKHSGVQLPSDFLYDNHKSLQRRNDFEDMCESLDELQFEAIQEAFQDGFILGEFNILKQFVQGKLDKDYIIELYGDKLFEGESE